MKFGQKISQAKVKRLPIYYRALQKLEVARKKFVSSMDLAEMLELKPEKIRADLLEFDKIGIKGLGYNVKELKNKIASAMGLQNNWHVAIIGAGNLGAALANYDGISNFDLALVAIFDIDKEKIGTEINGVRVYDFEKFSSISRRKLIDIAILAVPDDAAQNVADVLAEGNVRGIWNFTSVNLNVPYYVTVVNENLSVGLGTLSFYMNQTI